MMHSSPPPSGPPATRPPAILLWWERLHPLVQMGVVAPLSMLLLWVAHIYLLNQPTWRGLSYGIFWGALVTALVVGASRSERARRESREAQERARREGETRA